MLVSTDYLCPVWTALVFLSDYVPQYWFLFLNSIRLFQDFKTVEKLHHHVTLSLSFSSVLSLFWLCQPVSFFLSLCNCFFSVFSLSTCCRIKVKEFRDTETWSFSERPRRGVSSLASYLPTPLKHTSTITLPSSYFNRGGHCSPSIHPLLLLLLCCLLPLFVCLSLTHTYTLANSFVSTLYNLLGQTPLNYN